MPQNVHTPYHCKAVCGYSCEKTIDRQWLAGVDAFSGVNVVDSLRIPVQCYHQYDYILNSEYEQDNTTGGRLRALKWGLLGRPLLVQIAVLAHIDKVARLAGLLLAYLTPSRQPLSVP